jgi:Rrf2 family protein
VRLSQAASYGISSLTYLASAPAGALVSNSIVCRELKMPERFVLQIMRTLVNAGIVTSARGVAGGYKLVKPTAKITLLEIVEIIDGPLGDNRPVDLAGLTKESQAKVEKAIAGIEADVRTRLAAVTLADLRAAKAA